MLSSNVQLSSIEAAQRMLLAGDTTVEGLVRQYLDAIERINPKINAVLAINEKAAEDARKLDALPIDQRGPLFGTPILIKDQIETEGIVTTFGNEACKDYVPSRDATLVTKLKNAGAIILGKTTMPDWAASWFSTSSLSETTKNPHDLSREPGGSSSGSGAAIAAGLAIAAIGGDTGGSIRLPASFCGLVGVRVTPGRISRDGMSALVTPQDTPGPMVKSVADAAKILDVIVGFDERDPYTSVNKIAPLVHSTTPFQNAIQEPHVSGRRFGVLRQAFGTDPGIGAVLDAALSALAGATAELVDVEIPDLEYYKSFTSAYVTRSKSDINEFLADRKELSHLKIEELHSAGHYHKALDLIDAFIQGPEKYEDDPYFSKRLLEQSKFQRIVASIFAKFDLDAIIYPTCQLLPPKTKDILDGRWTCLNYPTNTIIGSQLLFPAVSIPVGKSRDLVEDPTGPELPVGLEVLGLPLREEVLLAVAAGIEAVCSP